jgi:hypothetical protein
MSDLHLESIPMYKDHSGTIRVAGDSLPVNLGRFAFSFLAQGVNPIDFMCIGANANQQATKGMGIFAYKVSLEQSYADIGIAFIPLLFKTETIDHFGLAKDKSVTIWRTLVYRRNALCTTR